MEIGLHAAINRLYHAQKNIIRPKMALCGLSPGQPKMLRYLAARGSCIQRELAENCDIEPATVSRLLDTMERQGLVKRVPAGDRRMIEVSVTAKGLSAHNSWVRASEDIDAQLVFGLSDEDKKKICEYIEVMYKNLTGKSIE